MKNKTFKILSFLVGYLFLSQTSVSQNTQKKDTLYFDADWKVTTKENHKFYRPLPLKTIDSLSLIVDYYKNGNMQMQGYTYTNNIKRYAGDMYWYGENGYDMNFRQYINLTNKPLTYYHNNNSIWKTITYKNNAKEGEITIYNSNGISPVIERFKNGTITNDTIGVFYEYRYASNKNDRTEAINKKIFKRENYTKVVYWNNSNTVAQIINYQKEKKLGIKILEERTYSKKGKLIQHLYEKDYIKKKPIIDGMYYDVKTKNGFAVALDSVDYNNQKSKVIKINNISYVGADDYGDLEFYKKQTLNNYLELNYNFLYNSKTHERSIRIINEDGNDSKTLKELNENFDTVISIDDIKTQSVNNLLQTIATKQWSKTYVDSTSYKKEKHKIIFKQFNSELFTFLDLAFSKNNNRGFGSYSQDDRKEKWRINKINFYTINVILLNKNKPILTLSRKNDIKYYIIPTNKDGLVVNFRPKGVTEKPNSLLTKSILKQINQVHHSDEFYRIKSKKGKEYIANSFNEIIIDKGYDSIQRMKQYILGKHKKYIDIYNFKLDKLPFHNIRQVYYDKGNLQILTDNTVKYIDPLRKETQKVEMEYLFCGTVGYTSYKILKTNRKDNLNAIEINSGHVGISYGYDVLLLKNLDTTYNLTFLNKTKTDGFDGNSRMIDGYVDRTNLLVATKNNKVGLYSYSYKDIDFKYEFESKPKKDEIKKEKPTVIHKKDGVVEILPVEEEVFIEEVIKIEDIIELDENTPQYGSTNAKELLPVIYDKIELRDPLIIVEKDDRLGIYPLKNGLKYKSFGEVQANFMSYEAINGEKGWIDVNTLQEYQNK